MNPSGMDTPSRGDSATQGDFNRDAEAMTWVGEEVGLNRLLGLYDVPAFARRGQATESALEAFERGVLRERALRLKEVVRRLDEWRDAARSFETLGPDELARRAGLKVPIEPLIAVVEQELQRPSGVSAVALALSRGEAATNRPTPTPKPPPEPAPSQARAGSWSGRLRLRARTRALRAAVERFNRLWDMYLSSLDLSAINQIVNDYNSYYLLEKECVMGSRLLAGRLFEPLAPLEVETLRRRFPPLPMI
ncbi:hypothetical protein Isop_0216 [Isosphaera pallida ATCC 43644]|uniref:Uncharacterized protein n=1 Tax=Isosphaera pallida (strain ATCC 43644 / DSM 9630 / IS1B) TaxID=575540 RepID=E8QWC6_ISOPI|nr:hypothetical protein [Isosphaera pallida]ADV60813.1 hypothetical protein Isop_0216 [Isosphaera pallida ATCC 43644]